MKLRRDLLVSFLLIFGVASIRTGPTASVNRMDLWHQPRGLFMGTTKDRRSDKSEYFPVAATPASFSIFLTGLGLAACLRSWGQPMEVWMGRNHLH